MPTDPGYRSIVVTSVVSRLLVATVIFSSFHCLSFHYVSPYCATFPLRFPPAAHSSPACSSNIVPQPKLVSRGTDHLCALCAAALTFHQMRSTELSLPQQLTWTVRVEICSCGIQGRTPATFCVGNSKVSTKECTFYSSISTVLSLLRGLLKNVIAWEALLKPFLSHSQEFRFSVTFFSLERIFSSPVIEIRISV